MSEAPKATTGTGSPRSRLVLANVVVALAYLSYLSYLLNSFTVKTFISEVIRLMNKFVI